MWILLQDYDFLPKNLIVCSFLNPERTFDKHENNLLDFHKKYFLNFDFIHKYI